MPRPPKRLKSDDEVAAVAARLGRDWRPGDGIETWLRQHVEELTSMVREQGWSWGDIGRALNAAGIEYQTARPWSAAILRKKAVVARSRLARGRAPTDAMAIAVRDALTGLAGKIGQVVINMPGSGVQVVSAGAQTTSTALLAPPIGQAQGLEATREPFAAAEQLADQKSIDDEAENILTFEPASIIGWTGPKPPPSASSGPKATSPAPAAKQDADEVMQRFLGKRTV